MKSMIVGTAGHIDHGKTALVKALTGIDADRLEEEKRRGITIDLGFAHMQLPGANGETLQLGFVDVPGHERFVRNMLAGVGGIDLVLLVIAADESIKPQTREHFDILQLLGVRRGITVLTKSDAVDPETLDVVRLEVEEFLRGTFLESPKAPIVAASSLTGAGLTDLKQAMAAAAAQVEARDSATLARLPIDRVFTMKGFGTVVTGTLISGTIRREDELEAFPTGRRVRVRGVQVHGKASDSAIAGQRTALNLVGATTEDLTRGMTLAPLATFTTSRRVDVRLNLLASAPRPLRDRARVHFHSNTMETVVHISPIGGKHISPGSEVFARLKLPEAALLVPGDRFIIRQFSPVVTIGGGIVLDAAPIPRMPDHKSFLQILASGDTQEMLVARIARRGRDGISLARLVAETGRTRHSIEKTFSSTASDRVRRIGDSYVHGPAIVGLEHSIVTAVGAFQKNNPLAGGIAREALREQMKAVAEVFTAVVDQLTRDRKIETSGELVRLPGHGVVMKDEEADSTGKIEAAFATAGLKVPALHEVLAGLKLDKARAQKLVTLLLRDRVLVKISEELVFHHSALKELRRQMAARKVKSPKLDVATFKEITGVSRKYAIPLLEYLDRERVTRRVGDMREIL
ncbi:MAG TPA: selenocysteine-specific translation elongation factor [Candidatus Dormibacteraeota bacterium]|nr:selenocysteine-specific translation elongation factor [Candidatus Dormibacteraeota bacterium]